MRLKQKKKDSISGFLIEIPMTLKSDYADLNSIS